MQSIRGQLENYWFQPMPAARLGMVRAAVGAYALWYVWTRRDLILELSDNRAELYEPVGVLRVLGTPMDSVAVQWMVVCTILSGCLFIAGALYRYSGPAFAILLFCTLCYRNSWSMIYHSHNVLVFHVLILGFSRSADAFALDSWRSRHGPAGQVSRSWEYGWPIRLIIAVIALSYFLSGAAKVLGPEGVGWASGESMRSQVAVDTIRKEILEGGGMTTAFVLFEHVWVFAVLGAATLVLELGAPLFVVHRWVGRVWAVAVWAMHWGIFFIMGIKFRYQLCFIMFLPFFPIERLQFWRTLSSTTARSRSG